MLWTSLFSIVAGCRGEVTEPAARPPGDPMTMLPDAPPGVAPMVIRRLTNREYAATIETLFGFDGTEIANELVGDVRDHGYDNAYGQQALSLAHAERYMVAAERVVERVEMDSGAAARFFTCEPGSASDPCSRSLVDAWGRRIYRRPLAGAEIDALVAIGTEEISPRRAALTMVQAMLQSPSFLFRVERGEGPGARPDTLHLSGYEVATRLAFTLFGATPDDALLDAAESGRLETPEGVSEVVRGLLDDPRLRTTMGELARQWFRVQRLDGQSRDGGEFPEFSDALVASMKVELDRRVSRAMWDEGDFVAGLYASPIHDVDAELAAVYGVPAPSSFEPRSLDALADRGGFFTSAAFATLTSRGDDTSPISRGVYIREVVLCDPLPPPIRGVMPPMPMEGESLADAEERHTADPVCASCHTRIDPIGHGLERYDPIGRLRASYWNGEPVRLDGLVEGLEAAEFSGGVELGANVARSALARDCAIEHVYRWSLGRGPVEEDAADYGAVRARFAASGYSFRELLVAAVASDVFLNRPAHLP
jgi:hypothetical protein